MLNGKKNNQVEIDYGSDITAWQADNLENLLEKQSENLGISLYKCAEYMTKVNVLENTSGYNYNDILGFSRYHS